MTNLKRNDMLIACLEEFAAYGYEKGNTNRIAERASVSKGLLFHYFGSKQKLYMTVLENCINDIKDWFDGFSVEGQPFLDAMLAYANAKATFFSAHPLHYKLILQAFYNPPDELKEAIMQQYSAMQKEGTEIISSLMDRLPLKPGVPKAQAIELVSAVSNIVEKKYISTLLQMDNYSSDFVKNVREEYVQLMRLILYGIAEKE